MEGTLQLARELIKRQITPILFSSDYVFDGKRGDYSETSPLSPINEYGRQKAELERRMEEECRGAYLMLRCSKVYGLEWGDGSLIDQMRGPLLRGERIRAASDQVFAPLFVDDLIAAIEALQEKGCRGLFNLCGPEVWCRLELAYALAEQLGVARELIEPIELADLNCPYGLPKCTTLNCRKFSEATSLLLTPLSASLATLPTVIPCEHAQPF